MSVRSEDCRAENGAGSDPDKIAEAYDLLAEAERERRRVLSIDEMTGRLREQLRELAVMRADAAASYSRLYDRAHDALMPRKAYLPQIY